MMIGEGDLVISLIDDLSELKLEARSGKLPSFGLLEVNEVKHASLNSRLSKQLQTLNDLISKKIKIDHLYYLNLEKARQEILAKMEEEKYDLSVYLDSRPCEFDRPMKTDKCAMATTDMKVKFSHVLAQIAKLKCSDENPYELSFFFLTCVRSNVSFFPENAKSIDISSLFTANFVEKANRKLLRVIRDTRPDSVISAFRLENSSVERRVSNYNRKMTFYQIVFEVLFRKTAFELCVFSNLPLELKYVILEFASIAIDKRSRANLVKKIISDCKISNIQQNDDFIKFELSSSIANGNMIYHKFSKDFTETKRDFTMRVDHAELKDIEYSGNLLFENEADKLKYLVSTSMCRLTRTLEEVFEVGQIGMNINFPHKKNLILDFAMLTGCTIHQSAFWTVFLATLNSSLAIVIANIFPKNEELNVNAVNLNKLFPIYKMSFLEGVDLTTEEIYKNHDI